MSLDQETMNKIVENQELWIKSVLDKKEPYDKDFLGLSITVYPNVFPPCGDSRLLGESLKIKSTDIVLDMWSGSGAQSIITAKKGAQKVIAIDINPDAVNCIKYNIDKYDYENKIEVRNGNLFDVLRSNEKFDVVIFNPPFMDIEPKNMFEKAVWDKDQLVTKRFFKDIKNYLNPNATIYMVFSNWGNFELIEQLAKENNFTITKISEKQKDNEKYEVYTLTMWYYGNTNWRVIRKRRDYSW